MKTLILDIETSPMLAYVWGLKDQNVSLSQLKADWFVMSWTAKWLGDPPSKIEYRDQRNAKNLEDDRQILKPLWKLLNEADLLITQNGQNFDGPKLNARFMLHGWPPPSSYRHLDTYQIVRKVARFTSNKLEYLTGKMCTKYKKLSHKRFPGLSLWTECIRGNKQAWEEMRRYNIHDVLSTEEFYTKIRAWVPESMPSTFDVVDVALQCRACGVKGKQISEGVRRNKRGWISRFRCKGCGAWASKKADISEAA
jgi:DNA polymerase elongation subunit (family B)